MTEYQLISATYTTVYTNYGLQDNEYCNSGFNGCGEQYAHLQNQLVK